MSLARSVPRPATSRLTWEKACLEAFQSEFDYLCQTLQRLGGSPSDIDDLAQEVFLVLQRTWDGYDAGRPLRPYLFGIAFRVVSAQKRRRGRERPLAHHDVEDRRPSPDRALQIKQDQALILSALDRIPLPRRAVLVMHDLDDVPAPEVALAFSLPLFTVYSRLRKARKELGVAVRRLLKEKTLP
jgi:RNA polymerase sigma-70 factor, ECF subfamily